MVAAAVVAVAAVAVSVAAVAVAVVAVVAVAHAHDHLDRLDRPCSLPSVSQQGLLRKSASLIPLGVFLLP